MDSTNVLLTLPPDVANSASDLLHDYLLHLSLEHNSHVVTATVSISTNTFSIYRKVLYYYLGIHAPSLGVFNYLLLVLHVTSPCKPHTSFKFSLGRVFGNPAYKMYHTRNQARPVRFVILKF